MNRQFYRSSVGGLDEVAEIKGHRRTFVASFPGRIVQALKVAGTSNPLILIDEIDKLSHFPGGPGAALLEVLDPQQNHSFNDHYLNVPCDLSRVLFVCTANDMSPIPRPLKDRMQIIPLSGYVLDEKVTIARRYLLPQLCKSMGIQRRLVNFKESALKGIAQHYSRESGVRSMKRNVETIIARQLSETDGEKEKTVVTADTLPHYLGHPRFYNERMYKKTPPGGCVVKRRGRAWAQHSDYWKCPIRHGGERVDRALSRHELLVQDRRPSCLYTAQGQHPCSLPRWRNSERWPLGWGCHYHCVHLARIAPEHR
mmetsp:Transcript_33896/g.73068  ORF Transcript_33896/g.73068 Transcript_33896/m.73068 type:complete len:312 (-) Transcript_33896:56-991(-)